MKRVIHTSDLRSQPIHVNGKTNWRQFIAIFDLKHNFDSVLSTLQFVVASVAKDSFIAIRDFKLICTYKTRSSEGYKIEKNCRNPEECSINYQSNFLWSKNGHLPRELNYFIPNNSNKMSDMLLNFNSMANEKQFYDAIISIDYWISSDDDVITIENSYGNRLPKLYKTLDQHNQINWSEKKFKLSYLYPPKLMNHFKDSKNVTNNLQVIFRSSTKENENKSNIEKENSVAIRIKYIHFIKVTQ